MTPGSLSYVNRKSGCLRTRTYGLRKKDSRSLARLAATMAMFRRAFSLTAITAATSFVVAHPIAQDRLAAMPGYDQFSKMQAAMQGGVIVSGAASGIQWNIDGASFTYNAAGKAYRFDFATMKATETGDLPSAAGAGGRGARGAGGGRQARAVRRRRVSRRKRRRRRDAAAACSRSSRRCRRRRSPVVRPVRPRVAVRPTASSRRIRS